MPKARTKKAEFKVTFGGWYQRTTLHLSEIYDLFELGHSKLKLSTEKLRQFKENLDLAHVSREAGYLECVKASTNSGIEIRYYEDGLYMLQTKATDIKVAQRKLESYFEKDFSPAISYIFSLGAPTPKILANINSVHPTVVGVRSKTPDKYAINEHLFGEVYSQISSKNVTVYKTPGYIFVVSTPKLEKTLTDIIGMQIFFREFKDQLEKYLNIHRYIWEEISSIKERKDIKGNQVGEVRSKLDSFEKTIDLIMSRINQMGSYISTRSEIARDLKLEKYLVDLFQFKFEVLANSLDYIKEIWKMTKDYISAAIKIVVEVESQATTKSVQSLQVITSIGVISGVLGYLATEEFPTVSFQGAVYFVILIVATWVLNFLILRIYSNLRYKITFIERAKKI